MRAGTHCCIALQRYETSQHQNSGDIVLANWTVSQGLEMNEFLKNEHWLIGPFFLHRSEHHWPVTKFKKVAEEKLEIKKEVYIITVNPTAPWTVFCPNTLAGTLFFIHLPGYWSFCSGSSGLRKRKRQTHMKSHGVLVKKKLRRPNEKLLSWYRREPFRKNWRISKLGNKWRHQAILWSLNQWSWMMVSCELVVGFREHLYLLMLWILWSCQKITMSLWFWYTMCTREMDIVELSKYCPFSKSNSGWKSSSEGGYWEMYILQEMNGTKDDSSNGRVTQD